MPAGELRSPICRTVCTPRQPILKTTLARNQGAASRVHCLLQVPVSACSAALLLVRHLIGCVQASGKWQANFAPPASDESAMQWRRRRPWPSRLTCPRLAVLARFVAWVVDVNRISVALMPGTMARPKAILTGGAGYVGQRARRGKEKAGSPEPTCKADMLALNAD